MTNMMTSGGLRVVVGGILVHLTIGTLYCLGTVEPYVTSYIRLYHPSVTSKDTFAMFSYAELVLCLTSPWAGLLQFTLGLRGCAALGVLLVGLTTLGCSMATSVAQLVLLSAVFGCGIACAYTCPLVSGYAWLPHRKGLVSGFVVAGFGMGGAVFNLVAMAWVNPDNVAPNPETGYYDEDIARRVPGMYLLLGTIYLGLGLCGVSMLAPPRNSPFFQRSRGVASGQDTAGGETAKSADKRTSQGVYSRVDYCPPDMAEVGVGADASPREAREQEARIYGSSSVAEERAAVDPREAENDPQANYSLIAGDAVAADARGRRSGSGSEQRSDADLPSAGVLAVSVGDGDEGWQEQVIGSDEVPELRAEGSPQGVLRKGPAEAERDYSMRDLVVTGDFYLLPASLFLTALPGVFFAGAYKDIAFERFPDDDRFLSLVGSSASFFNASSRIVVGFAIDRFGCFSTLQAMSMVLTVLLVAMYIAGEANRTNFFVGICLLFALHGMNFAVYPTLTAKLFGATKAGPNYGLVQMGFGIASFIAITIMIRTIQGRRAFIVCAGFPLTGAFCVLLLWIRSNRKRYRATSRDEVETRV